MAAASDWPPLAGLQLLRMYVPASIQLVPDLQVNTHVLMSVVHLEPTTLTGFPPMLTSRETSTVP
jgi:hypothetical protein